MPKRKFHETAGKEEQQEDIITSLQDALKLVEAKRKVRTLQQAGDLLNRIRQFRPAIVALVDKMDDTLLEEEVDPESMGENDTATYMELLAVKDNKCCRGGGVGKHIVASELLRVAEPIMKKYPNPTKLHQIAPLLERLLTFTRIVVKDTVPMVDYDKFHDWLDSACDKVKSLGSILDPSFLWIRGPGSAGVIAQLQNVPIGILPSSANLTVAPAAVVDPTGVGVGATPIPGLYEFVSRSEAGLARVAVMTWINGQAVRPDVEIVRFTVAAGGFEFLS